MIDDGCVQAALVVKEETMENIRVLVKTTGFAGVYHETVSLTADCDLSVIAGEYGNQETTVIPAGETFAIGRESELFAGDGSSSIIRIEPSVLTGRISLLSVERSQGTPSYRGSLELRLQEGRDRGGKRTPSGRISVCRGTQRKCRPPIRWKR